MPDHNVDCQGAAPTLEGLKVQLDALSKNFDESACTWPNRVQQLEANQGFSDLCLNQLTIDYNRIRSEIQEGIRNASMSQLTSETVTPIMLMLDLNAAIRTRNMGRYLWASLGPASQEAPSLELHGIYDFATKRAVVIPELLQGQKGFLHLAKLEAVLKASSEDKRQTALRLLFHRLPPSLENDSSSVHSMVASVKRAFGVPLGLSMDSTQGCLDECLLRLGKLMAKDDSSHKHGTKDGEDV